MQNYKQTTKKKGGKQTIAETKQNKAFGASFQSVTPASFSNTKGSEHLRFPELHLYQV